VLFVVMGLCVIRSGVRRKHLAILALVLFWSAPALLFWCSKLGNNARHLMVAFAPLALLVAGTFTMETRRPRFYLATLAVILVANYFVSPDFSLPRTGRPSSRLFEAHKYVQARVSSWHEAGRAFAALPDARKELFGADYTVYGVWEVLARAKDFHNDHGVWRVVSADGEEQAVKFVYVAAGSVVPLPDPGWNAYLWTDNGQRSSIASSPDPTAP
jgi:hypothetical protein